MTAASRRPRTRSQRFRAAIQKQGVNPHVDVPQAIIRAFAAHARAGRISFEGTINGAEIRGTLVPAGSRRHRLYVNGGMRSAAGVAAGDTVSFELVAIPPEAIRPPADLAA